MSDYTGPGFVIVKRTIQNTKSYENAMALGVYVHCQMRANIKTVMVKGRTLQRGQFITSTRKLADECGLPETKMRRILERLKKDGLIEIQTARNQSSKPTNEPTVNGMVITVVNYGVSDTEEVNDDDQSDERSDKQLSKGAGKRSANSKRKKKEGIKEKIEVDRDSCALEGDKSPSSAPQDYVEMQEALIIANHFENQGFIYTGTGGGKLAGMIARKIKEGYTKEKMMEAFGLFQEERARGKIRNHSSYYLTVLDSLCPNGPE